jgi:fermentation-respiration switch protein FrsA (DUF1100 family)
MRFHDLAVGTDFEYRGRRYVKTGPLTARAPEGGDRIIPRSAPVTSAESPGSAPDRPLPRGEVLDALAAFEQACRSFLDGLADQVDGDSLAAARAGIDRAGERCRARLALTTEKS